VDRATRIGLGLVIAVLCAGLWSLPISAATPRIALTLTASPNPGIGTSPEAFIGTATPIGGSVKDVVLTMRVGAYSCSPAANCQVSQFWVNFTYRTLSSKVTFRANGSFQSKATLDVGSCNPQLCLSSPVSVTVQPPTLSASATYSPAGAIMPGENVRFTIHGSTNVGPLYADVQTTLGSGLAAPTGLSSGVMWSATTRAIDDTLLLARTGEYSFYAVVTAALGSTVKFVLKTIADPNTLAPDTSRTVVFHVGPLATPTPRPTPRPTPHATLKPSPTATRTQESSSGPASPVGSAGSTAPGATGSVGPELGSPVAEGVAQSMVAVPPASPNPTSIDAVPAASVLVLSGLLGFVGVLGLALVLTAGLRRRQRR
jgi:hypothetical protein